MTGTEIAEYEPQTGTLALRGDQVEWTPVQRAALAHLGIEDAPAGDQQVFMHVAQRTGLDPFAKQLYMIPRQEGSGQNRRTKWTIQTGIDGFRLIAERHPQYRGQVGPQWCGEDGEWRDVWLDPQKTPAAARVGILRGDRQEPTWGTAMFREYAQTTTYDGQSRLTKMWREKSAHMIAKCAEALALRRAFPTELGGLHTDDEMANADRRRGGTADAAPAVVQAVTAAELTGEPSAPVDETSSRGKRPDATAGGEATGAAAPNESQGPPSGEAGRNGPKASDAQIRRLGALFGEADCTERQDRLYLTELVLGREVPSWDALSVADANAVIDGMEQLKKAGHGEGLVGAVNELFNRAEQQRLEAEENDQAAAADAQPADDDQTAGEQS